MIDIARETDIGRLRQIALLLERENHHLHDRLRILTEQLAVAKGEDATTLQLEIELLTEQLARQRQALFGESSEKRRTDGDKPKKAAPEKTGHGPTVQPNLPIVPVVHELDEADRVCPCCGGKLCAMDGQFEESEEVDVVERSFRIVRHRRTKYSCNCGSVIETAPGPAKLISGGRYSIGFAAEVAVAKYLDHLPLARQVRQMHRQGLTVTTQTLWDQLWALHLPLIPTYQALHDYVLSAPVVGADETTWRLMGEKQTSTCWVWSVCREDAVFYRIEQSRSANAAAKILRDFGGTIVCDGYSAYSALVSERRADRCGPAPPVLAHCWAHVRRKFVEAAPNNARAEEAVKMIGKLYAVEADARRENLAATQLRELRHEMSRPVTEELRRWMLSRPVLPKSGIGRAIGYADKIWTGLTRFLEDPAVPLDNNQTERGIRGVAIGRKNHYGARSERGLEVAGLFYTLMESAKVAGVEPALYLRTATERAIASPGTVTLPQDLAKS